jgi:hypothetical protein
LNSKPACQSSLKFAGVRVYFCINVIIHDPNTDGGIPVACGTLFGPLVLTSHGVSFSSVEVEDTQVEFENESATNTMPLTVGPVADITSVDYLPDYNAASRSLVGGHFASNGSSVFAINNVLPTTAINNYLQARTGSVPAVGKPSQQAFPRRTVSPSWILVP